MRAIAATIIFAEGWRRRLIAFCAGATGALALAPFDLFPALAIPMTIAVWLVDGAGVASQKPAFDRPGVAAILLPPAARRAFWDGWWWGFGYFLAGLWWLGAAFLVEAEEFAWALPLGVIGFPAYLAIFPGLGFLLARLLWAPGPSRLFALGAGLTFAEWLRGQVLTGFPWNAFGMALGGNLVAGQLASVLGLYGLTLVAIVVFAAPAALVSALPADAGRARSDARSRLSKGSPRPLVAALIALAAIWSFGALRLARANPGIVEGVKLRIMQPNLAQDEKFRPENKDAILAHYLALSQRAAGPDGTGLDDVTALIWPESAFPFILSHDRQALAEIGAILPLGAVLVTGAARQAEVALSDAGFGGLFEAAALAKYFNAIQVIGAGGGILDSYDKVHLVPFGEYLPLRSILEPFGLHHFVHVPGGFEAGAARRQLHAPGLPPIAPLVCYEAIFPAEVLPRGAGKARPGWLLNVTNDGWFGMTAGPYQHFAQARLRAIEEGLPLARAASTGISAIIDPYGRIVAMLPLGVEGILDGGLPQKIAAPIFALYPLMVTFATWFVAFAIAVAGRLAVGRGRTVPWRRE